MVMSKTKTPLVSVVIPTHNRKDQLVRLIESINESSFRNIETIVIDDNSTDGTYNEIVNKFQTIRIFRNDKKRLVSACRNIGIKNSRGDFIFLVDDDNILDSKCIENLLNFLNTHENVGVVAPLMYYFNKPTTIWCAGIRRSKLTSRTITIGNGKQDGSKFNVAIESDDFPNAFMVRRTTVITQRVLFDEQRFPFMYEESDFTARIKRNGWKVMLVPSARIWHDVPKDLLFMGRYTSLKAYYLARNRIIFHKKYTRSREFSIFKIIFLPFLSFLYASLILQHWFLKGQLSCGIKNSQFYIRGTVDGVSLSRKFNNENCSNK